MSAQAINDSLKEQQPGEHLDKSTSEPSARSNGDPHNPVNWPEWKKDTVILMVSFHSMVSVFVASGLIPGFKTFAEIYDVSLGKASYLVSAQVCLPSWPIHSVADIDRSSF